MVLPVLKSVTSRESPRQPDDQTGQEHATETRTCHEDLRTSPSRDTHFITTTRGGSSGSLQSGSIPTSLSSFVQTLTKSLPPSALPSSPPHHHLHRPLGMTSTPQCSSRLAKKTCQQTPVVATTQNLLLKNWACPSGLKWRRSTSSVT
jgi:hypothetical protein